ncbi:MAG: hypothetical protein MUF47_12375 [Porphyrobacter sp.]|jgi:hypothetical protein|nr:hypothetical protein [Porphyrobacter sp.]
MATRRTLLAGLLKFGALAGLHGAGRALNAAPVAPLRLPDTSLRLTRVLDREVGTDATIRVERSWEVYFERQGRGAVLTGRQTAVEVSVPPNLAAFAQIERQRDTSAMFPLLLGETGQILSLASAPDAEDDAVSAALRMAEAVIARAPMPEHERERQFHYLARVHAAGSNLLNIIPPDLFFPSGIPVNRRETVMLPDGLEGRFALSYVAHPQVDAPWLARAERRVQIDIGDLSRSASEVWTLGPL